MPAMKPMRADISEEAVAAWRNRIRTDTFGNYHYQMGLAMLGTGELAGAERSFNAALALDPNHIDAWAGLVDVLVRLGRSDDAAAADRAAREIEPGYGSIGPCRRGLSSFMRGSYVEAAEQFGTALKADPTMSLAGWMTQLLFLVKQAAVQPESRKQPYRPDIAKALSHLGRAPEVPKALRLDCFETCRSAGRALHAYGMIAGAVTTFEMAERLDTLSAQELVMFGQALQAAEKMEEGRSRLLQAVAQAPDNASLVAEAGVALLVGRTDEEGLALARRAFEAAPWDAFVIHRYGLALLMCDQVDAGAEVFEHAWSTKPEIRSAIQLFRGLALQAKGDVAGALSQQRSMLTAHPGNSTVLIYAGLALEGIGQRQEALELYQKAASLEPGWFFYYARMLPLWAMRMLEASYHQLGFKQ